MSKGRDQQCNLLVCTLGPETSGWTQVLLIGQAFLRGWMEPFDTIRVCWRNYGSFCRFCRSCQIQKFLQILSFVFDGNTLLGILRMLYQS
ncbi:hypothetical protein NMG60_11026109 [Bertholletia excelsa]